MLGEVSPPILGKDGLCPRGWLVAVMKGLLRDRQPSLFSRMVYLGQWICSADI